MVLAIGGRVWIGRRTITWKYAKVAKCGHGNRRQAAGEVSDGERLPIVRGHPPDRGSGVAGTEAEAALMLGT